jgi:hypothetical protein
MASGVSNPISGDAKWEATLCQKSDRCIIPEAEGNLRDPVRGGSSGPGKAAAEERREGARKLDE